MGKNNITNKVEDAAKAYLQGVGLELIDTDHIHAGLSADDIATPYVACVCQSAECEEIFDGNWSANLELQVVSNADSFTAAQHKELAAEVFSWWFIDKGDLRDNLSASLDNFTAHFVIPRTQSYDLRDTERGRFWESRLSLVVKCCGSDIT